MPAHIDQVVKMKNAGMQWQWYDAIYRQKRGKRIARGSKKVSGWVTLDVVLYLECKAGKLYGRQVGQKGLTQRPSTGLTSSQDPARRPYVSAQSDEKAPPPSMAFLYTPIHVGSSTKDCTLHMGSTNQQPQQAPLPFPGHFSAYLTTWGCQ